MCGSGNYPATGKSWIGGYCQTLHGGVGGFLDASIMIDHVELFRIWYLCQMALAWILQFLCLNAV